MESLPFETYSHVIRNTFTTPWFGEVKESRGLLIESQGPPSSIGDMCTIHCNNNKKVAVEVVGFCDNRLLLMPLGEVNGIAPGMKVSATGHPYMVGVGPHIIGRVLDGSGNPIDGKGSSEPYIILPLSGKAINPLIRQRISQPLWTQIRAIDSTVTIGRGQRIGIFSGSGTGKSVLLGMIAQKVISDVNVIALIGERGREVREFIEKDLGEEGLRRSVVVVVTSDMPAVLKIQGVKVAMTIAEYFRDLGKHVVFMMDSITRLAMAQREIGLSIGEPPSTKGYTPSVFAFMPTILERAGTSEHGSITGIYTVLVEGDDMNEPVADMVRSILDGHIVLSRKLAQKGHYPAIDILQSISRVQKDIIDGKQRRMVIDLIQLYADYNNAEDLITIGAYVKGSSPRIDRAMSRIDSINDFLKQDIGESTPPEETMVRLANVVGEIT
jgi:flagellum-specific ATP synthase